MSNILLENALFTTAGGTSTRNLKSRWADWINVKDFGAVGDGIVDDTTSIQAAMNSVASPRFGQTGTNVGTVYIPPGRYKVTSALTMPNIAIYSIIIRGDGPATEIFGNFNGFIFDQPNVAGNPSGMIIERMLIRNTNATAATSGGIRVYGRISVSIKNCQIYGMLGIDLSNNDFSTSIDDCELPGPGGIPSGSIGIFTQAGGINSCDITGYDSGVRLFAGGCHISNSRFEENNIGVLVGADINGGSHAAAGVVIDTTSFEANGTAIYLFSGNQITIQNVGVLGEFSAENVDANNWSLYALRIRGGTGNVISSFVANGSYSQSTISFDSAATPSNTVFQAVTTANSGGAPGGSTTRWNYNSNPMGGIDFFKCDQISQAVAFASLPASPALGWTAWINNSNTSTFRATIAGGGANLVLGVYNGTNWTVAA